MGRHGRRRNGSAGAVGKFDLARTCRGPRGSCRCRLGSPGPWNVVSPGHYVVRNAEDPATPEGEVALDGRRSGRAGGDRRMKHRYRHELGLPAGSLRRYPTCARANAAECSKPRIERHDCGRFRRITPETRADIAKIHRPTRPVAR